MKKISILIIILVILLIASTQVSFFVIQPMGAVPEGKTLVISRLNNLNFIDSADAVCERTTGNVNLLGRGLILATVAKNAKIILRLPYSETLYLWSTGGKKYSK